MNSWEKILQHMERRVNPHSFATWFVPTKQEGADNGTLVVRVPSRPFRKRLTETYGELLQAVLVEVGMADVQISFVCNEPEPATAPAAAGPTQAGAPGFRQRGSSAQSAVHVRFVRGGRLEPVRACRRARRGRSAFEGLQPALPLWRRGHGQNSPDAGHRPYGEGAQPGPAAHLHQRRKVHQ